MLIWRFYPFSIFVGLIAGSAVAALGTFVAMAAVMLIRPDELAAALERTDVHVASLIASFCSSLAAGYVAARSAPGEELLNACATGVILVLLIASYSQAQIDVIPHWLDRLSLALALPLAVTGGLLFRGRARNG